MRKIIILSGIAFCMLVQNIKAQSQGVNFGDLSNPVPSVSSLAAYNSVPMSNATGIPAISIPMMELTSRSKDVSLGLSLSYNALNIIGAASDVGTGWSLFGGGVISRSINEFIDEIYDNEGVKKYRKNQFDDIYYYNAPGISGKFKFVRDINANTFELVNLSSNKDKIEYTRTSNTATLILNSFTITDAKGNKYFFNDYSKSNLDSHPYSDGNNEYFSAFFLTQIVAPSNVVLATFNYQKYTKYKYLYPHNIAYEYSKLKTITSPGLGKIEFDYLFADDWAMNDPYQTERVVLKDQDNHIIYQYRFEYSYDLLGRRELNKVKKIDKNNVVFETTGFEYRSINYNPPYLGGFIGAVCSTYEYFKTNPTESLPFLRRIINPSGGVVEYNFEFGWRYKNRQAPDYLSKILNGTEFIDSEVQYIVPFGDQIIADTKLGQEYPLTVTGTGRKKIFITLSESNIDPAPPIPNPWEDPTPMRYLDLQITKNGINMQKSYCGEKSNVKEYNLDPGVYTIKVFGTNGTEGIGTLTFNTIGHIPQPFTNTTFAGDLRIGNIKYYNSNKFDEAPLKTTRFDYTSFTDNTASSGYTFFNELDPNGGNYALYRNVKVIDDNNGYTKYYYKTPDDYPQVAYPTGGVSDKFWAYHGFTSGGLLDKKEVYDSQNNLLTTEQSDYVFEDISDAKNYQLFYIFDNSDKIYSKPALLKKLTNTSTSYFNNGRTVQQKTETDFSPFNFEPVITRKYIDGSVEEKKVTYPETGYPNLTAAHILNTQVVVEEKIDGKLISRTETQFANPASVYPTGILSSNIENTAVKNATIDLYDENGNVLQLTSVDGKKMTTVYGYYKTLPIATIEGATYAQIAGLIQNIMNASDADAADPSKETLLLAALDAFRNNDQMKEFQITTYTYDPLIGSTTVTSPNGMREIYKYDVKNRLEKVVDKDGMILKEYKYNYKN